MGFVFVGVWAHLSGLNRSACPRPRPCCSGKQEVAAWQRRNAGPRRNATLTHHNWPFAHIFLGGCIFRWGVGGRKFKKKYYPGRVFASKEDCRLKRTMRLDTCAPLGLLLLIILDASGETLCGGRLSCSMKSFWRCVFLKCVCVWLSDWLAAPPRRVAFSRLQPKQHFFLNFFLRQDNCDVVSRKMRRAERLRDRIRSEGI